MSLPIKILFADDDEEDQMFFDLAVKDSRINFEVTMVNDGGALMKFVSESLWQPDAIFTDINMPKKNGLECLKSLRSKPAYATVPVMIYSTSAHDKHLQEALLLGANRYIHKPNSVHQITEILQNLFAEGWQQHLLEINKKNFLIEK